MTLFGYGNTTKAIAKRYKNCKIYDDKFNEVSFDEYGNTLLPMSQFDPSLSTIEIVTPGIPPYNKTIKKAKNLISDLDFFAKEIPFSIWISGTNGKTTTTQMIDYILKAKGSQAGGNIGLALADMDFTAPIFTLEVSSFTLHYNKVAKPNIYILLPITPDHISWHGSFDEYEEAKLKPIKSLNEGEVAIIPSKYKDTPTDGFKICYENSSDLVDYFGFEVDKIEFKEPFLLDSLLALAVSKILFDEVDYELLNSFEVGSHKIEEFRDIESRLWVDDSKATNIDATLKALKLYEDKELLIILGGDDKGADIEELFIFMKSLNVKIFTIGTNAQKIKSLSNKYGIECEVSQRLEIAVESIDKVHTSKSIAILSPSASSLDQFSSYKERGESFKKAVRSLSRV
jgi:UDP-N-acetylmuramoylalanine--D-glutamate ligase